MYMPNIKNIINYNKIFFFFMLLVGPCLKANDYIRYLVITLISLQLLLKTLQKLTMRTFNQKFIMKQKLLQLLNISPLPIKQNL